MKRDRLADWVPSLEGVLDNNDSLTRLIDKPWAWARVVIAKVGRSEGRRALKLLRRGNEGKGT